MVGGFPNRIIKAQQAMVEGKLDLLIVVNRENLIYFTGMTQIECVALLIPREGEACAITLWLDQEYVEQESGIKTFGYLFPQETLVGKIIEQIERYAFKSPRIGFERYFVDFAVYDGLRQVYSEKNFTGASDLFYKIRSVKEPGELLLMRQAAKAVVCGMQAALNAVETGVTELDVLAEAEYAMLKAGSDGVPFRPQVIPGSRALLTHPCASQQKLKNDEIVVIHLGAMYQGYIAKMCRTVALGKVSEQQKEIYQLLIQAQQAAIVALKPGACSHEVDLAARNVIRAAGYEKYFLSVIGYGVGLRQSEFYPIIGKDRTEIIEAGMVVDLLLPTIYLPRMGGPRVTDTVYVGEAMNEILTAYAYDF
jgi:Xaa-Pro aminopeptidase